MIITKEIHKNNLSLSPTLDLIYANITPPPTNHAFDFQVKPIVYLDMTYLFLLIAITLFSASKPEPSDQTDAPLTLTPLPIIQEAIRNATKLHHVFVATSSHKDYFGPTPLPKESLVLTEKSDFSKVLKPSTTPFAFLKFALEGALTLTATFPSRQDQLQMKVESEDDLKTSKMLDILRLLSETSVAFMTHHVISKEILKFHKKDWLTSILFILESTTKNYKKEAADIKIRCLSHVIPMLLTTSVYKNPTSRICVEKIHPILLKHDVPQDVRDHVYNFLHMEDLYKDVDADF